MKYNGFYFWMFKSPMKKVLAEKYGREYAADIMKKSKRSIVSLSRKQTTSVTITLWHTTSCSPLPSLRPMWQAKRKFHQRPCRK